jgi:tetratricopeptide (TPR) repeat protein
VFQLAVTLFPDHARNYLGLGHAYAALGERALAIERLKRALELDPGRLAAAKALEALGAKWIPRYTKWDTTADRVFCYMEVSMAQGQAR